MDFNQTGTDILMGDKKNRLDFGDLDSIFKVTGCQTLLIAWSALYFHKLVGWLYWV